MRAVRQVLGEEPIRQEVAVTVVRVTARSELIGPRPVQMRLAHLGMMSHGYGPGGGGVGSALRCRFPGGLDPSHSAGRLNCVWET